MDGYGWALFGNQRVDAQGGIMMCELKGRMDKGGYCDVQMKRWLQNVQIKKSGWIRWALCLSQSVDAKGGVMMCKLKGWIDKGGHYDVEIKI